MNGTRKSTRVPSKDGKKGGILWSGMTIYYEIYDDCLNSQTRVPVHFRLSGGAKVKAAKKLLLLNLKKITKPKEKISLNQA